jgi:LysR family hca operon transcriptional activator
MELRHLRYFAAVAEELNFTRAANRLHTAQPSLSQQVRQLEDEIGTSLFERDTRKVQLTPAGRALLKETREILRRTDHLVEIASSAATGKASELSIGVSPLAEVKIVPKIVPIMRERYPRISLMFHSIATGEQLGSSKRTGSRHRESSSRGNCRRVARPSWACKDAPGINPDAQRYALHRSLA